MKSLINTHVGSTRDNEEEDMDDEILEKRIRSLRGYELVETLDAINFKNMLN